MVVNILKLATAGKRRKMKIKLIDKFEQALKFDYGLGVNRKRNFFHISKEFHKPITLYVKESVLDSGFWGLNENQLNILRSNEDQWAVVLLARSQHFGFFLKLEDINAICDDPATSFSVNDYKIHEPQLSRNL